MGRYSYSGRPVSEDLHKVDIYWLKKRGILTGYQYQSLSWSSRGEKTGSIDIVTNIDDSDCYAKLSYTITRRSTGKKDEFQYKVPIVTTSCYFGGVRYWFKCPAVGCGRRVAKLYQGQDIFACRHCYNVSYQSRNETKTYRTYPFNELLLRCKVDEIEKTMRKKVYKGKLTKKSMRIRRIERKMLSPYVDDSILDNLIYKV